MQSFKRPTSIDTSTPEGLAIARVRFWPAGSGPLGVMKQVVALIEALAAERGWDIDSISVECFGRTYTGNPPQLKESD